MRAARGMVERYSAVQILIVRYVRFVRPHPFGRRVRPAWGRLEEGLGAMDESDLSVLRERAKGGDEDAVDELIELAGELGNLEELRRLADQGNTAAGEMLAELDE
jgi:hypothetical protein